MRTPALPSPRRIAVGAGLAVLAAGLTPIAAATANPAGTDLVISEVYGAGGNTGAVYNADFVELRNPTAAPISLAGKYLHYRAATGNSGGNPVALSGSVPAGGTWLVQMSGVGAVGDALPAPDQTASPVIGMAGAGGQVILATIPSVIPNTTAGNLAGAPGILDMVGTTGATSFETAATSAPASATVSLNRNQDTDNNSADFTTAGPSPTASAAGPVTGPAVATVTNKSFVVGEPITPFTVTATGGATPYTWSATGLPAGLSISSTSGEVSGTPATTGNSSVTVTATDADEDSGSTTFTISVTPAAGAVTPIAQIQGTGAATPLDGQTVTTQGVVTASYPAGGLNGFYIQTPGADTPDASDAVFVYGGTSGFASYPAVGDSVKVTGQAAEFSGATQIVATDSGVTSIASLGTVTPKTVIPGTDCALPGTSCLTGTALDQARELAEGELFQPTAPWTATDVYDGGPYYNDGSNSTAFRGELGVVANSAEPLVAPTEIIDAQATAQVAERKRYNDAHRIILDDGSSWTFSTTQNNDKPFPWFTDTHSVRVGSAITFPKPVVFTYGFNAWRVLPQSQVVGDPTGTINFSQTRPSAPEEVGGDLKLATFNVLNFFPTTGAEFVSSGLGTCTYYNDRSGAPISNNQCNPNGPRGAANEANLVRQRDKIVAAINTADADIVSLEELENSVQFGKDRDFAINKLVDALNAAAGAGTWAAVPSPAASELPPLSEQDVIRNGFIYQPANVALVGASDVLADLSTGTEAFADAREPVAQAFKKVGTADADAFAVIVNHFKSKGSGTADPNGQGNANDRRILQANALVTFANEFKTARGISRVFLAGDFNAYSEEDPIQVLEAAGYTNLDSDTEGEESYNFDGMVGSLDHVLANEAALATVEGVDVWDINAYESVYYEYARFNTNVTNLYVANPYRSSDHNPEIVGIDTAPAADGPVEIQVLGTNDFHGRLLNSTGAPFPNDAGAAVLSGAVKQLRGQRPNTVFAAAGDLIGASTFESFIQKDVPTIDALNEAGLEVSAVGNHEFDAGYADLVDRVIPLADWEYIGANVDKPGAAAEDLLEPTFVKEMDGVQVGFIGAVTEHLDELVSPAGIEGVEIEDIVTATNREADALRADGVDVIVLLVHEGAPSTACATMDDDPASDFGSIITSVNDNVDAIVSGHTHLAYNCSFPVAGWADREVTERPVVSAGQYGTRLNQLLFEVDPATGEVEAVTQTLLDLENGTGAALYPVDAPTKAIVDAAVDAADTLGAEELGKINGPFYRSKLANGTTENRGNESTLGNLVAEVQRWATPATVGGAQIAFMNPGGMRDDMVGVSGEFPRTLTYRQAANVQSFANTLVNMDMTGAQIKDVLEQQWQPTGASRPFLRLGVSEGFTYTYDATKPAGSRITAMWLDGEPVDATTSYSVTANSFLAGGGDNFGAFNQATGKQDTGKVDLAAMVEYMAEFADTDAGDQPLPVDYSQRAVNVTFPAQAPASYAPGDDVEFSVSSLSMSGPGDLTDTELEIALGDQVLGTTPVTTAVQAALPGFDETGTASVDVVLPDCASGETLTLTGDKTGTTVLVPIEVDCIETTVVATDVTIKDGSAGSIPVAVTPSSATGQVVLGLGQMTLDATLVGGKASIAIAAGALPVGVHRLPIGYTGDDRHASSKGTVTVTVTAKDAPVPPTTEPTKVDPTLKVRDAKGTVGKKVRFTVRVKAGDERATGWIKVNVKGSKKVFRFKVKDGKAMVKLPAFNRPGTKKVVVRYLGDDTVKRDKTVVKVRIRR
ncbi:ExeM/NucH family extracellular endonuclease [Nocardioides sp. zg-1228]|uniref:ExeM/NucH family extracellular endonuclease n=1 Tax=Nocardioides sp. zg-1228 TaxID=2763008 RepID=UPI0016433FD5|nr:ExeM/NucH family extracellular endonuclease [Nocardioides sp. zg-1228]MBC2934340.1 ExeM/NucH family extracellular endonuclease [Nocardioides sp. zg-1228]QSF59117.1 ExeM/NucH family extracellular endonuclease [Nocardioides sp. zg-1228]